MLLIGVETLRLLPGIRIRLTDGREPDLDGAFRSIKGRYVGLGALASSAYIDSTSDNAR